MRFFLKNFNVCLRLFLILCADIYYFIFFIFHDWPFFYKKVHVFKSFEKEKNLIIIAVYSKNGCLSENMMKTISILRELNIQIILVSNGKLSKNSISRLRKISQVVIEQLNCGRDFGAFKTGFEYFNQLRYKNNVNPDKIIFMNDSTLILTDQFKLMMKKVSLKDWDFLGLTENYETQFHVSSYFFGVSKKIFQSDWFVNYWKTYKRVSSRKYAIGHGELGLSKLIIDKGYFPFVLFSSVKIGEKIFDEIKSKSKIDILTTCSLKKNTIDENEIQFSKIMETLSNESNIHRFNLFLILHMNFPFLKRDLVKRGIVNPAVLDLFFSKMSLNLDKEALKKIITTRESISNSKGFRKLLIRYGII